ncbi:UNVERIFIED_CONTAM: hypothetical protein HDU68_008721, partial [Siphonaria sp. JEL0065]
MSQLISSGSLNKDNPGDPGELDFSESVFGDGGMYGARIHAIPLPYGLLLPQDLPAVLDALPKRKLDTNSASSKIKIPKYTPQTGSTELETTATSETTPKQRKARAWCCTCEKGSSAGKRLHNVA